MLKNWPGLKIKHELENAGSSQAEVARECEVTSSWVHQVIFNNETSDKVRRCIAKKIGVDVKTIWPEYYLRNSMVA